MTDENQTFDEYTLGKIGAHSYWQEWEHLAAGYNAIMKQAAEAPAEQTPEQAPAQEQPAPEPYRLPAVQ